MITDPRIYGGVQPELLSNANTAPARAPAVPLTQAEAASRMTQAGPDYAAGAAFQDAVRREKASILESIGAAFSTSSAASVLQWWKTPDETPDADYDWTVARKNLDFVPTEDEMQLLERHTSHAGLWREVDAIKQRRLAYEAMADNPTLSFVATALDPGWVTLDLVAPMAGRAAAAARFAGVAAARADRFGKNVATGIAAGGSVAVGSVEQEVTGKRTGEILADAVINTAAARWFYNPVTKQMDKVDPKLPDQEIAQVLKNPIQQKMVQAMDADGKPIYRVDGKPHMVWRDVKHVDDTPELRQAETVVAETAVIPPKAAPRADASISAPPEAPHFQNGKTALRWAAADAGVGSMARALLERLGSAADQVRIKVVPKSELYEGGRAYYSPDEDMVYLSPESTAFTAVHEIAHAVTARKMDYGLENPNTAHGALVKELERIRAEANIRAAALPDEARDTSYFTGDVHEFVAGLFSGDTQFTRLLAGMKDRGTGTILTSLFDAVRKLLGILPSESSALARALQLTDDIIALPDVPAAKGIYAAPPTGDIPVEVGKRFDKMFSGQSIAKRFSWSLNKTLGRYSEEAKRIANKLVSDPTRPDMISVDDTKESVRRELFTAQAAMEDAFLAEMAKRGAGLRQRIFNPRQSIAIQDALEKELARELAHQWHYSTRGIPIPPSKSSDAVKEIAAKWNAAKRQALAESKAAGVLGADGVDFADGYFSRHWNTTKIEALERKLIEADGIPESKARAKVVQFVGTTIKKANPDMTDELVSDISNAIVTRTLRKGYGEDSAFTMNFGKMTLAEIRDLLSSAGLSGDRMQRALDFLGGQVDEAGKAPYMKHRIDMDVNYVIKHADGTSTSLLDLWDTNLLNSMEHYMDRVAGQVAFARHGYGSTVELAKLRNEYMRSIPNEVDRAKAGTDFDNTVKHIQGLPTGDNLGDFWRNAQVVNRSITLAWSGLWQFTEIAPMMAKHGVLATTGALMREVPGFKQLFSDVQRNPAEARSLTNILSRQSYQELRLRPYIRKHMDNFDTPVTDAMGLALEQAQQLVPYSNAMKWIQQWQSNTAANLIVDTLERAVRGDAKAIQALEEYGLKSHLMDRVRPDIERTLNVDEWSDGTWELVREPLSRMMDDDVLRARSGEIPAFVQHTSAGKVLFAFRNFQLAAHNKILMGTLNRRGWAGLALIAAYQFPLTALAVAAQNSAKGKEPLGTEELFVKGIGQMGSLGLFTELFSTVTGEASRGSLPALIVFDRMRQLGSNIGSGEFDKAAESAAALLPIINAAPITPILGEVFKD